MAEETTTTTIKFDSSECVDTYNVGAGDYSDIYEARAHLYDQKIFDAVEKLRYDLKTNLDEYKNNGGDITASRYTDNLNLYDYLNDDKFKTFFRDNAKYTDGYGNSYDYIKELMKLSLTYNEHFMENLMMVKQIKPFDCCYYDTFFYLKELFQDFFNKGRNLCHYDKIVKTFVDNFGSYLDAFYDDTDDKSGLEYYTQVLDNALDENTDIYNEIDTLQSNIEDTTKDYSDLSYKIKKYLDNLKLLIKLIAVTNIIFTLSDEERAHANDYADTMNNIINQDSSKTGHTYYELRSFEITQYQIKIAVKYRGNVDSMRRNYNNMLKLSLIAGVRYFGFDIDCLDVYKDLQVILPTLNENSSNES